MASICRGCPAERKVLVHQVDPAQLAPDEFSHLVREVVEENGARVVVIDSLNGYLNSMPDERFLIVHRDGRAGTLVQVVGP